MFSTLSSFVRHSAGNGLASEHDTLQQAAVLQKQLTKQAVRTPELYLLDNPAKGFVRETVSAFVDKRYKQAGDQNKPFVLEETVKDYFKEQFKPVGEVVYNYANGWAKDTHETRAARAEVIKHVTGVSIQYEKKGLETLLDAKKKDLRKAINTSPDGPGIQQLLDIPSAWEGKRTVQATSRQPMAPFVGFSRGVVNRLQGDTVASPTPRLLEGTSNYMKIKSKLDDLNYKGPDDYGIDFGGMKQFLNPIQKKSVSRFVSALSHEIWANDGPLKAYEHPAFTAFVKQYPDKAS